MARRNFLVSYDVSNDKRRTKIFHLLQANGDHAQFSVFVCQLNHSELAHLRARLQPLVHTNEDQVLIIDLGKAYTDEPLHLEAIGQPYVPVIRAMIV